MNEDYARDLWRRATNAARAAESLLALSPDDAASRAYYAAFHAVCAAFATENKAFTRHSAVRAAVHKEWVKNGIWTIELGAAYDTLWELRDLGDYGGLQHVSHQDAQDAVASAKRILEAVLTRYPRLRETQMPPRLPSSE